VPFAAIVLIALGIAVINIHPPIVLFGVFVMYGMSGYVSMLAQGQGAADQRDQHLDR
jgi:hypothetical protein